jgi:hypothetical protein
MGAQSTLRRQRRLREGGKLLDEFQVTTTRRTATMFHVLLPGLVTLQAVLCAAQCSFWHALLQYSTLMHALHLLWPS